MNKERKLNFINSFCNFNNCSDCNIAKLCKKNKGFGYKNSDEELDEAILLINSLIDPRDKSKEIIKNKSKWIKMTEYMPEDNVSVLLKCEHGAFTYITIGTIVNGNRGTSQVDPDLFNRSVILAWCPLPED